VISNQQCLKLSINMNRISRDLDLAERLTDVTSDLSRAAKGGRA